MKLLDRLADTLEPVFGVPRICADCGGLIFEGAVPHVADGVTTYYHPYRCEQKYPYRPLRGVPFPWTPESLEAERSTR